MGIHRILVVDDSPAVRETIGILLGGDYEVQSTRVDDYTARGLQGQLPNLIIAARPAAAGGDCRPFPAGVPVLWIDSAAGPGPSIAPLFARSAPRVAECSPRRTPVTADHRTRPAAAAVVTGCGAGVARRWPPSCHASGRRAGIGKRSVARAVHGRRQWVSALCRVARRGGVMATPGWRGGASHRPRRAVGPTQQALLPRSSRPTAHARRRGVRVLRRPAISARGRRRRLRPRPYYRITVLTVAWCPGASGRRIPH